MINVITLKVSTLGVKPGYVGSDRDKFPLDYYLSLQSFGIL